MRSPHEAVVRSNRPLLALFSGVLCACALAACGGPADEAPSDDALEAEALSSAGTAHVMPLDDGTSSDARKSFHLSYYGGRVIEKAEVVAVSWGDSVSPEIASGMGPFYKAALGSSYMDWLSEYDTGVNAVDGSPGTGQHVGRGSLKAAVVIHPKAHGKVLSDAAIRKELTAQITARKLPAPGPNTIYMLNFPNGISIEQGGSRSCSSGGFCAYHNSFRRRGKEIDYGVLPDLGPGSGCETGCGHGTVFDNQTSVASHEMIETVTDPEVGLAKGLGPPLAWYDQKGGEIGDLCNGMQGKLHAASGKAYSVQKEWSNKSKACIAARGRGGAEDDASEDQP